MPMENCLTLSVGYDNYAAIIHVYSWPSVKVKLVFTD